MKSTTLIISILVLIAGGYYKTHYSEKSSDKLTKADSILVEKGKRRLYVYSNGQLMKSYRISLGRSPEGDKKYQGDNKTPEGSYYIKGKNPSSRFHKSLWISYPVKQDIEEAKKVGKNAGGSIVIHGITNGYSRVGRAHLLIDWTRGCIAVTNKEIDELYDLIDVGVPIRIIP